MLATLLPRCLLILCCLAASGCAGTPGPARVVGERPPQQLVIAGADVLTMAGPLLEDRTVIIRGDRVADIRPFAPGDLSAGGDIVDGRGKVLMPGLVDMHVHFAPAPGEPGDPAQRAAAVMLAHGVTTARSMAGAPEHVALRENIESGAIPGPRIYTGSPPISDASVSSPEEAAAAVRAAKQAGFDFIKSHHVTNPAAWQAAKDEADRLGLATAGHVTNAVGLERAMRAKQQIEHLDGFVQALLPPDAPERAVEFGQIPPPPIFAKVDTDSLADAAIFDLAAAAGSWHVPTLGLFEKLLSGASAGDLRALPEMRFVPDAAIEQWAQQRSQLQAQIGPEFSAEFLAFRRALVRSLDAHGVPIMAGSDTAQAFHIWGPALHEEIAVLAETLSPEKALRAATVVPRDYFRSLPQAGSALGWEANFGTIEDGARADMILLSANPLDDLSALERPEAVVAGGRLYRREALDAMLDAAAAAAKGHAAPAAEEVAAASVYLMRHLEADAGGERHLTAAGKAQAEQLAALLADAGIEAIYVTDTARARETAALLAQRLALEPAVYDPARPDLLLARLEQGGPALVVAHSNTAPALARALGADAAQAAALVRFGTILKVGAGEASLLPLGARSLPADLARACGQAGLPPDAICGALAVPENRERPSRMIDIHFAILPATGSVRDAPLVVLPGGPGLGAVQAGGGIAQLFADYREDRDILLIDQRGTGESNRLACQQGVNGEGLLDALESMDPAQIRACRDRLAERADLTLYGTREAVLDMEAVRQALGYERLDLFGMSYGTRPALDYLRLFPERTGEVVIRAAAPVGMELPLWTPRDAQASYRALVATCAAQPACAARHPDLAGDLERMLAQFGDGPVAISVVDPRTGERVDSKFGRDEFATVLFFMLYIPEFSAQLPGLIERAADGNFSPMVQAVSPALTGLVGEVAWGMRWSVICGEDIALIDPGEIDRATAGTFMGRAVIDEDIRACELWPRASIPAAFFDPVSSEKPVLIISGAHDPIAGPVWGSTVADSLGNARHVVVQDAAHLPALPGCMAREVETFLTSGDLGMVDADCPENTRPLRLAVAPPPPAPGD